MSQERGDHQDFYYHTPGQPHPTGQAFIDRLNAYRQEHGYGAVPLDVLDEMWRAAAVETDDTEFLEIRAAAEKARAARSSEPSQ